MYHFYYERTRKRAIELRKNMTPWERHLWYDFLRTYPVKFKRQVVIHNFIVDFCCNEIKFVIELDGGGHYTVEQKQYDMERTIVLQKEGYFVVRFSNYDIDTNFNGVCEHIDNLVKTRCNPSVAHRKTNGDSSPQKGGQ